MKVQRFEDLEAWQIARELTNQIYTITKKESICRDFGFVDQIRRAAISIMYTIAEGFERGTNKDFAKYVFLPVVQRVRFEACYTLLLTRTI